MRPVAKDGNYFFRHVRQFVTYEITENNLDAYYYEWSLQDVRVVNGEYGGNIELVAIGEIYDVCICLFWIWRPDNCNVVG